MRSALQVQQSFVYGDPLTSCLVAVVVPDLDALERFRVDNHLEGRIPQLCKDPRVVAEVLAQMTEAGRASGLQVCNPHGNEILEH